MSDGRVLDASWQPGLADVIRIREAGTGQPWSFVFETPIPGCTFIDMKPDTEYEVQARASNGAGAGEPAPLLIRTDRAGPRCNVVPLLER